MSKAFSTQNVEKYQLSEIQTTYPRRQDMYQWVGIFAYLYSVALYTKSED